MSRAGSKGTRAAPTSSASVPACAAAITASASAGTTVSGRWPARPSMTARSVAWPLPVQASEP